MQAQGAEAVTPSVDDAPAQPANIRRTIVSFKRSIYNHYGWSLHDIDEADFDNLFTFVTYQEAGQGDSDTRIIDGHISRRVTGGPPSWL